MERGECAEEGGERYRFEVVVTGRGPRWETTSVEWLDQYWGWWVKVCGDTGRLGITAGHRTKDRADRVITSMTPVIYANGVRLGINEDASPLVKDGKLVLVLVPPAGYRETNEFLARTIEVPPLRLQEDMATVFSFRDKKDIRLGCRDGEVDLHSSIVGVRSPQFKQSCKSWPMGLSGEQLRIAVGWSRPVVSALVHFLYCGMLPPETNLTIELSLFDAAHYYSLPRLAAMVARRLCLRLSPTNLVQVYSKCLRYSGSVPARLLSEAVTGYMSVVGLRQAVVSHIIRHPELYWTHSRIGQFAQQYHIRERLVTMLAAPPDHTPAYKLLLTLI